MINNEIVAYIRGLLNKGASKEAIEKNLLSAGWTNADVGEAFAAINAVKPVVPATPAPAPTPSPTPAVNPTITPVVPAAVSPQVVPAQEPVQATALAQSPILHLPRKKKFHLSSSLIIGSLIVVILLAGVGYAYVEKVGPFKNDSTAFYTEENLLSGLIANRGTIKTSSHIVSMSLAVGPRDSDATAFLKPGSQDSEESTINAFKYLPEAFKFKMVLAGKTDSTVTSVPDSEDNIDVEGDLGDVQYKINIDVIKKGDTYYLKVNNIPSILLGLLPDIKGEWIKFSQSDFEKSISNNQLNNSSESFSEAQESYEEKQKEISEFLKQVARIAEDEKLLLFRSQPEEETIDSETLYRYDLSINKDAVVPFLEKIIAEAEKTEVYGEHTAYADMAEGLKSEYFSEALDYYTKNIFITLWTDKNGSFTNMELRVRFVPPPEVVNFSDKQINFVVAGKIFDINQPVNIEAPTDAKSIEELKGGGGILGQLDEARNKGSNAAIKANLSNLRASAELYYFDHSSYGSNSLSGSCVGSGSMFREDSNIAEGLKAISDTQAKGSGVDTLVCYSSPTAYAVSASLISADGEKKYWCVDSTGLSKGTDTKLTGTACK